jgi:hypothetical protein
VWLAVFQLTIVFASIRPVVHTLALYIIVFEFSLALASVRPGKDSIAFHLVVAPLTFVDAAIGPLMDPLPLHVILIELSLIGTSTGPCELADSMFLPLFVLAFVAVTIRPWRVAITMIHFFLQVALIPKAIMMGVNNEAMMVVIFPVALADISVSINEAAFTIGFVVSPPALVHGTIGPYLDTLTLSNLGINKPIDIII